MKRLLLTTAAVLAAPTCVLAQETTPVDDVIVTATRLPAVVQDTPGAHVIDEDTIRLRGAVFAQDVLADVPGLSVYRAGPGGVTSVRMRGAAQDKSLVLIDGVPVNDPSQPAGGFDFLGLDLGATQRIEVLSGPQSSLWGSDAIGGVIALVSREVDGLEADLEAGSFDTRRGRVSAGVSTDRHALGVNWTRYETDGISAAASGTEDDGVEAESLSVNGRLVLTDRLSLEARARQSDVFAEIDDFGPVDSLDTTDTRNRSGFVRLNAQGLLGLDHQLTAAASDIHRVTDSAFPSTYEGERRLLRWQADGHAGSTVAYAFGLEREETEAFLNGYSADLGVDSAFGTLRWDATDRLTLNFGLRHDSTDDFGGKTTGRASAAYDLGGGFTLSGAYGTGFKTPSVSQAVCDFCFVLPGTVVPALVPETASGGEIALGWRSADGRFDGRVTAYRLEIDDQIDGFFDLGTFEFYYVNIDETRTDGIELEGRADLGGGFELSAAYAWTDARDLGPGTAILRVPEHAGSATLAWRGDRLTTALTVRAEGDMPDSGGTRDGFTTANLNAALRLTDQVELTARIENLADETYEQLLGYGEPGRSGFVGVRLRY
jgi:vitamin B12 transporter